MSRSGEDTTPPGTPVSELSYTEASRELDSIVEFFEQREVDVDQLVARLERAAAIVDELDRRIRRTRAQVEQLVPRLQAATRDTAAEREPAGRTTTSKEPGAARGSEHEDWDGEAVDERDREVARDREDQVREGDGEQIEEEEPAGDEPPLF